MSKLTGLKDVDREVLKHVSDKDLLVACSVDRRMWNEVCDDAFLRRRLTTKYSDIEKYKTWNETWKRFFLRFVYYISKMWEKYSFEYTGGDFKKQYTMLQTYKGDELLFQAASEGELSLLDYSIKQGGDIHAVDVFLGATALSMAARNNNLDIVHYLVERGVDIHMSEDLALRNAALHGNLDVVKYLVEKGADIHTRADFPVRWASENGHLDVVKYLVEKGANINSGREYALRYASENGHLDVVKYLVEQGADIHAEADFAIKRADEKGHSHVVQYLKSLK